MTPANTLALALALPFVVSLAAILHVTGSRVTSVDEAQANTATPREPLSFVLGARGSESDRVRTGTRAFGRAAGTINASTASCTPPVNDAFADSVVIAGISYLAEQSTDCATRQLNEPQPCGIIGSTVWFAYQSLSGEVLQADTAGSDFDTVLAVYTGSDVNALTNLACDDDSGVGLTSASVFEAAAGVTYYIQAGGFGGATGTLQFGLSVATPTPTPTHTPAPTETPTPCPCSPTPTVTATPTSQRPAPVAYIDETVDAQEGPITVAMGNTVTFRWVITCACILGRSFYATVNDELFDALDGTCDPYQPCERSAAAPMLTPGPVIDRVEATVCGYPPSVTCTFVSDSVKVNVVGPGPADSDSDGCTDFEELGPAAVFGGLRSPFDYWDFFDVAGVGGTGPDRKVDFSDTLHVLMHFGHAPDQDASDNRLDRFIPNPSELWRTGEANDGIDFTDALASLGQFGHHCNGPAYVRVDADSDNAKGRTNAAGIGSVL